MRSPVVLHGERGFTLVELLVVVLIIGVLAAIGIPSFLGQATANGARSKGLIHTASLTAETVALDDGYKAITKKVLQTYEPTIPTAKKGDDPWVSAATGTAEGYTLTVTSARTGNKFTITRADDGTVTRTCTIPTKTSPSAGCTIVKNKSGTW